MGSPTAIAPHSGPLDTAGELAYRYARSGVARSATTRSNYVAMGIRIEWITRDSIGNIFTTTDISGVLLQHSLHVTQAINDEPDTCSFTLKPQAGSYVPLVGQEIRITWAPGAPPLFHGYIVTTQQDWRSGEQHPPFIAVQCQDPMWRFDGRLVTYRFPAQSITASIAYLVQYFCNGSTSTAPHPLDFSTAFVQAGMPSIPAFDVVNQRPSTVMRTLTASVGGGFYIEGLTVHAWAGSVSEPGQQTPQPLRVDLPTLKHFRLTTDGTQIRRRVIVEGRRTATLIALPALSFPYADYQLLGVPLQDATIFDLAGGINLQLCRFGTQWMYIGEPYSPTVNGANPPQTRVQAGYLPGPYPNYLWCEAMNPAPPAKGWIRVGNQYSRYDGYPDDPLSGPFRLVLPDPQLAYGIFRDPIKVGETVEWVDCAMTIKPRGLQWPVPGAAAGTGTPGDPGLRQHPTDTPVVTLAAAQAADIYSAAWWPELEGFVQDGRYSYTGAQARATSDLAAFDDPLVAIEWETEDLNAAPGRSQVVEMDVDPTAYYTVTILRVDLSFPLPTLPPRRQCSGGVVKPSTFLDLVVTTEN